MVLGTSSCPGKLSGTKVDGRPPVLAGRTLYSLCRALPFQADSMATLMFKIANGCTPGATRADCPGIENHHACLQTPRNARFAAGSTFARDLAPAALDRDRMPMALKARWRRRCSRCRPGAPTTRTPREDGDIG